MNDLINYIDGTIENCIDDVTSKGLCHLIEDDNGVYPAQVATESSKVTPDDQSPILTYHRALNGSFSDREDLSFGKTKSLQNSQSVRMVVFIRLSESQSLIDDIVNALPDVFEVEGYRFCNVGSSVSLIRDRAAIWQQEFGEAHRSKFQKRFHIYAVEYTLEYVKCFSCSGVEDRILQTDDRNTLLLD